MFFDRDGHVFEIVGIYRAKRHAFTRESFDRSYSSVGIRLAGEGIFSFGNDKITAAQGKLLYIPTHLPYSQISIGEEIVSVCFIEHGEIATKAELFDVEGCPGIEDDFVKLYEVWSKRERGFRLSAQEIFYSILLKVYLSASKNVTGEDGKYKILSPAIERIYSSYKSEALTVTSLAGLCYISPTYFRRLFKRAYGTTPTAFIRMLRIDTAASLFETGVDSVKEVAAAVGYEDAKYFSREFKRVKGVSPKEYADRS